MSYLIPRNFQKIIGNVFYGQFIQNLTVFLLSALLYLPVLYKQLSKVDMRFHLGLARELLSGESISTPHVLFHYLTAGTSWLLSVPIEYAGLLILLISISTAAVLIFNKTVVHFFWPAWMRIFFVQSLLITNSISILYFFDKHTYYGYLYHNVYHNPTILLLKPFAIIIFFMSMSVFCKEIRCSRLFLLALSLMIILSAIAKPSFLVVYLPAIAIFALFCEVRKGYVDWKSLVLYIFMPSLLILGYQYKMTYSSSFSSQYTSSIIFAPLEFMKNNSQYLLAKFLLSILFPLAVSVFCWSTVKYDKHLIFSWLIFLVGASQAYLLLEAGPRAMHGNLGWGAQVGVFLLFITSASHFFRNSTKGYSRIFVSSIFFMHVLCGILFYAKEYLRPWEFW